MAHGFLPIVRHCLGRVTGTHRCTGGGVYYPNRCALVGYDLSTCGRFTYLLTWEQIVRLYRFTLDQPAQNMRRPPAFDRYREFYPRRSELHQNFYSRDGDEQSAVPAGV